jgi:hypothetical protein
MYKEKYLKYKTKYLDLKNQLGGNSDSNIIQDGGSPPWWKKFFDSPNKQKVEDKNQKPIAPQTQSIQEQLENGELLIKDYLKGDDTKPTYIIINPTKKLYKKNDFNHLMLPIDYPNRNGIPLFTENSFIILKKSSNSKSNTDIFWWGMSVPVGFLINYVNIAVYVIVTSGMGSTYLCTSIYAFEDLLKINFNILNVDPTKRQHYVEFITNLIKCGYESILYIEKMFGNSKNHLKNILVGSLVNIQNLADGKY